MITSTRDYGLCLSPHQIERIEAGDQQALVFGVACLASMWMHLLGLHSSFSSGVTYAHCVAGPDPREQGLLAAAQDLCQLLQRSPQGREAFAKLERSRRSGSPTADDTEPAAA